MKPMQVRFSTSEQIYQYLRDVVTFSDVDEYITELIERDLKERNYVRNSNPVTK